jgi:hypothetical protein
MVQQSNDISSVEGSFSARKVEITAHARYLSEFHLIKK